MPNSYSAAIFGNKTVPIRYIIYIEGLVALYGEFNAAVAISVYGIAVTVYSDC